MLRLTEKARRAPAATLRVPAKPVLVCGRPSSPPVCPTLPLPAPRAATTQASTSGRSQPPTGGQLNCVPCSVVVHKKAETKLGSAEGMPRSGRRPAAATQWMQGRAAGAPLPAACRLPCVSIRQSCVPPPSLLRHPLLAPPALALAQVCCGDAWPRRAAHARQHASGAARQAVHWPSPGAPWLLSLGRVCRWGAGGRDAA